MGTCWRTSLCTSKPKVGDPKIRSLPLSIKLCFFLFSLHSPNEMVEAFAAISIGASILQFITVATKLIDRINDFSSNAEEMPKALRGIHLQLPFLVETCQKLDTRSESDHVDAIIAGCRKEIEELYKTIDKVLPGHRDQTLNRAFKAFKSIRYEDRFERSLKTIEQFKTDLILHCCQETYESPRTYAVGPMVAHSLPSTPMTPSIPRHNLLREIDRKFEEYESENCENKIIVLLGMGGQGKSRLALDYGQRMAKRPGSKLVLRMDPTTTRTLTRSFEDVADRWNGRKRQFTDTKSRTEYVKEVLAEREWLLIFDNYDYPHQFVNICTFIPPGEGSTLITSRHVDAGILGKPIYFSGMDEREGLELLGSRTKQNLDDPVVRGEAIKILETLGHLPLAVDQAGAYICRQMLPIQQFLQLYRNQKEIVLTQKHIYWDYKKKVDGEGKDETPLGVLTTWELSIQQVSTSKTVLEHLLTVAAFLGHVEVSENLFREYARQVRPTPKWLQCFVTEDEWDSQAYRSVVSELLRLSIAQGRTSSADNFCLSLHPMIKDWLQLRITEPERCAYIKETIIILAHNIDANVQESSLEVGRGLLGHLDACVGHHRKNHTAAHRLGFGQLRNQAITFSKFYMSHGRYRDAEEGFCAVLENDTREFGEYHAHTLRTTRYVADAFVNGGEYLKAHDLLKDALQKCRNKPNIKMLHLQSGLAAVFAKLDRLADAEEYYEAALQGHAVQKELTSPHNIYSLHEHLAEVKRYLGKYEEAEVLYMEAHQGYEQECRHGEDATFDMLRTAGGLADLHRMHGHYGEAEISYREAWQGYKKQLGSDHPMTTAMLTNLAISCRNQEKFQEAEIYLKESVEVSQKSLGPDHPDTLRALMNLSICLDKQEKYKAAEINYREVLKGRQRKLGLHHPYTLRTIERLAHMLWMQEQHDKAEDFAHNILVEAGMLLGADQSEPFNSRPHPALETLYTEAWKRCKSKLSHEHVDSLETCECLRLIYMKQGEDCKAQKLADHISGIKNERQMVCQRGPRNDRPGKLSQFTRYILDFGQHTFPSTKFVILVLLLYPFSRLRNGTTEYEKDDKFRTGSTVT